jgi:hypothetical protein
LNASTFDSSLRTTVWPPNPPKESEVWIQPFYRVEGEFIYLFPDGAFGDLPDELYLREARGVDVSSDEELARFVSLWGNLVSPRWDDMVYGPFVYGDNQTERRRLDNAVLDRIKQDTSRKDLPPSEDLDRRNVYHFDEIRLRLARMRNLALSWDHLSGRIDLATLQEDWTPTALDRLPSDTEHCARRLSANLTAALRPFHVRVVLEDWDYKPHPFYTTYQAMCLQLASHLAAKTRYRVCRNENCKGLFVHQRGRAKHNHYRETGVYFCKDKCARAQNQRDLRDLERIMKLLAEGLAVEEIAVKKNLSVDKVNELLSKDKR